jgi:hypothetical protein
MSSADMFCADGRFVHLVQDWRDGLGWWLGDGKRRSRVRVSGAIQAVPRRLAHEERPKAVATVMAVTMLTYPIGRILGGWLLTNSW